MRKPETPDRRKKIALTVLILTLTGVGCFLIYQKFANIDPVQEVLAPIGNQRTSPIDVVVQVLPTSPYELLFAYDHEETGEEVVSVNMNTLDQQDVLDVSFLEDISFLQTQKNNVENNFNAVSLDGTVMAEVIKQDDASSIWITKIWQPGKDNAFTFAPGITPILEGFSSDARLLYFDILDVTGLPAGQINIMDLDTKSVDRTLQPADSHDRVNTPVLSPNKQKFAFSAWSKTGDISDTTFQSSLMTYDVDTDELFLVQEGDRYIFSNIVWSADSKFLTYALLEPRGAKQYSFGLWVVDTETKALRKIADAGRPVYWTPDNRYVIYTINDGSAQDIYAYDFDNSESILLVDDFVYPIVWWGILN